MKIAVCSDLHLEFGDINLQNTDNADVLILGGDICVAADIGRPDPHNIMEGARSNRITDFFKRWVTMNTIMVILPQVETKSNQC
jgi:3',5'-cyclic AMP phosphodiesterase CpdA